jgi:hypothetical protein
VHKRSGERGRPHQGQHGQALAVHEERRVGAATSGAAGAGPGGSGKKRRTRAAVAVAAGVEPGGAQDERRADREAVEVWLVASSQLGWSSEVVAGGTAM